MVLLVPLLFSWLLHRPGTELYGARRHRGRDTHTSHGRSGAAIAAISRVCGACTPFLAGPIASLTYIPGSCSGDDQKRGFCQGFCRWISTDLSVVEHPGALLDGVDGAAGAASVDLAVPVQHHRSVLLRWFASLRASVTDQLDRKLACLTDHHDVRFHSLFTSRQEDHRSVRSGSRNFREKKEVCF